MKNQTRYIDLIRTIPDYPVEGVNFYDLNSLFASPIYKRAIKELKIKKEVKRNFLNIYFN